MPSRDKGKKMDDLKAIAVGTLGGGAILMLLFGCGPSVFLGTFLGSLLYVFLNIFRKN
jgi:hypothetical protein